MFRLLVLCMAVSAATPPLFKQCDPKWGSDEMGVQGNGERATICKEGCAMSSLAMALAGLGVEVDGQAVDPGVLNKWLVRNKGYVCAGGDCNNLVLNITASFTPLLTLVGEIPPPAPEDISKHLEAGTAVYLAHVRHQSHFVLLRSWDASTKSFTVNDPGFNATSYPYDAIHDIIVYSVNNYAVPYTYPLYKQCDPMWGKDEIVSTTVCAVGCLMSSTSMAIGGKGIPISGALSQPGHLNAWLKANNGYDKSNDLEESVVPKIDPTRIAWGPGSMHRTNDISLANIKALLSAGNPVIANVMHGGHFVLVVGWDRDHDDSLVVNDPGFVRLTYSYSADVVGWRLYNITNSN